jgi:hypothetical protein
MGALVARTVPSVKGAVCYGLDEISKGSGARARLTKLRKAIAALAPSYAGLSEVFDKLALTHVFKTAAVRQQMVNHLNDSWFKPGSKAAFFGKKPVAKIYAEGVLKALDLSLKGKGAPLPIDAWWLLDAKEVSLISMASAIQVTLIIQTPRPALPAKAKPKAPWILGKTAEAHVTRGQGSKVVTKAVKSLR